MQRLFRIKALAFYSAPLRNFHAQIHSGGDGCRIRHFSILPAMAAKGDPHVLLTTSAGNIELELNSQKAPISVDNFLKYVNSGFYNNTTFHRVIPGFMVQGGGFNEQMQQKQPNPPIKNEADNGLRNTRGTIAMARTADQDSATSQFFINVADNAFLDHGKA